MLTPLGGGNSNVASGKSVGTPSKTSAKTAQSNKLGANTALSLISSPSGKGLSQMSFGDLDYDDYESTKSKNNSAQMRANANGPPSARRHINDVNTEIMTSFLPDTLASQVYNNIYSRRHMEHHSRVFEGVVMIVDISGFTKLSGAFCSKGRDGIDGLQKIVNGFMGILVEAVYSCGGDVIKFAGDALICIFEPDKMLGDKGLLRVCIQSVLCAWKLKDVHTDQLTAHIGIAYGDICFGVVGGHNARWEFLVSGACLASLSSCLDDAPSRNVAVTQPFHDKVQELLTKFAPAETGSFRLDGDVVGSSNNVKLNCVEHSSIPKVRNDDTNTPVAGDYHRPLQIDPPMCPPDMTEKESRVSVRQHMLPFIPQAVLEALAAETFNFIAELREVTTVFIKWDGYNIAEHADVMNLQKPFFAAQEIISHAGGFLRQFLVDDKGCVLIAMWGVPAATFPDNALRALWATVTMCEKLKTMHMPLSCGMTTGNVYCGTVGSMMRQEYAAIGDVVNLAARLMSKAHETIYIDEASFTRLPELVQNKLEGLPEIKVKGKDAPIKPYKYKDINDHFDFKDIGFSLESFPIRQNCIDVFSPLLAYLRAGTHVAHAAITAPGASQDARHHQSQHGHYHYSAVQSFFFHPLMYRGHHDAAGNSGSDANNNNNNRTLAGMSSHNNHNSNIFPQFVVVEGPAGTGRGRALAWFKHNAAITGGHHGHGHGRDSNAGHVATVHNLNSTSNHSTSNSPGHIHGIKVISVSLGKMDSAMDYSLLAKLFRQFLTEEEFDDDERQYVAVNDFLDRAFPTDKDRETKEKVAYPTMLQVLGVTAALRPVQQAPMTNTGTSVRFLPTSQVSLVRAGSGGNSGPSAISTRAGAASLKSRKMNPRIAVQSLLDIFQALLRTQPTLITVENSQYIDLKSWEIIFEIMNWERIRAVFVLASLPIMSNASSSSSQKGLSTKTGGVSDGNKLKTSNSAVNSLSSRGLSVDANEGQNVASGVAGIGYHKLIEKNFNKLFTSKHCHHVVLSQYSFSEMRVYLAHCLKVRPNSLPKGLDVLVFQLSAGNPLWVSEICEYIKTHSVQEFTRAMTGHDPAHAEPASNNTANGIAPAGSHDSFITHSGTNSRRPSAAMVKDSLRHITTNLSFYFDTSFISNNRRHSFDGSQHTNTNTSNRGSPMGVNELAMSSTKPQPGLSTLHEDHPGHEHDDGLHLQDLDHHKSSNKEEQKHNDQSHSPTTHGHIGAAAGHGTGTAAGTGTALVSVKQSPAAQSQHTPPDDHSQVHDASDAVGNNKLSFLIVCRFAKLSSESQTVARSASIIGSEFTVDILEAVTPRKLKRRLHSILNNLVSTSWLDVVEEKSLRGEDYKVYSFSHSLVHQSLYLLTPKGVRQDIHLTVAKFMEENEFLLSERHGYYEQLAYRK
jgi:class 3 adenylate cyclase